MHANRGPEGTLAAGPGRRARTARRPIGARLPRAFVALVAVGLAVLGGAGCEDEPLVLLRIDASNATASQLDTLEVTVTASRTDTGDALCAPSTKTFVLDPVDSDRVELPLTIAVKPGREYDRIVYVRVVGRYLGSVRIKTERIASLQGGVVTLHIPLTADCLFQGIGRTQHCVNGVVQESPLSPILDDGLYVEEGTPCLAD